MFRSSKTDYCRPCPKNFFCPSEQAAGLPNVVRCGENEFTVGTGAQSISDCVCLAGFKLIPTADSQRCMPCTEGQRCQDGNVVEELCHLQNKVASENHDECVCKAGFGILNFECSECTAGFIKPTSGNFPCLPCADGSYSLNSTSCAVCPQHADARAGSSACICRAPFVWNQSVCQLCDANHYWHNFACHMCPAKSVSNVSAEMPIGSVACKCAHGHVAVPQNVSGALACVPCAAGEYEEDGICKLCPDGAWAEAGSSSVSKHSTMPSVCTCNTRNVSNYSTCHMQLVDGSCAGVCPTTLTDCEKCNAGYNKSSFSTPGNTEKCTICSEGTFQDAEGAMFCNQCPDNEWHELLGQITVSSCMCIPGFERIFDNFANDANATNSANGASGSCLPCQAGHFKNWIGNELCAPCSTGSYNPHAQATSCYSCATVTQNWETLSAALTLENIVFQNTTNSTFVLSSNTTVTLSSTSVLECVCDIGQQPLPTIETNEHLRCQLCQPGSFKETKNHMLCTYCGAVSPWHGHSLLHHYGASTWGAADSSHCLPCPAFSGQDEDLIGPSSLRMAAVTDCMCFRGHEYINDACRNCSQYQMQPFFSSSNPCSYCPAGHYFVARNVLCQLCDVAQDGGDRHVGLVLNSRDPTLNWADDESDCVCRAGFERLFDGLCTACIPGKFRYSNWTRYCQLCPSDTFQDSEAQLACSPCPQNSSTQGQIGSTSVIDCTCAAGFQPMTLTGICEPCAAGTYRSYRWANESDAECILCPENYYCPEGAIYPLSCPSGEVSALGSQSANQCQCPPGYGRYTLPNCTLCPLGYFSMTSSNAQCEQCPSNKTTVNVGSKNQLDCVCIPGHGTEDNLANSSCTLCPESSFAPGYKNEPCTFCGWGAFSLTRSESESCQCNAMQGLHAK
jgi:hypothetical protein